MTVSLSVCVRPSVRSFVPFFSFSVFGVCSAFGMSTELFKVTKECFSSVLKLSEVLRTFQESFKDVLWKFQGCFKEVSRVFQGSFKDVSRKFQEYFKGILRAFLGCYKEVSMVI